MLRAVRQRASHVATPVVVRFFCVYTVLCWAPLVVSVRLGSNWWFRLNDTIGRWPITHGLGLHEHSEPGVVGFFLPRLLGMLMLGVISAAIAVVWAVTDRRHADGSRLLAWVHTSVRFLLATVVLSYGWAKILPSQFGDLGEGLPVVAFDIGDVTPRDLLWTFMAASRSYQVFTGVVEIAGGLLLLSGRTTTLGALVSLAALSNVFMLDLAYWVPAYFYAGQLLGMSLFVLGPSMKRLANAFVFNDAVPPAQRIQLLPNAAADRVGRVVGVLVAVFIAYWTFHDVRGGVEARKAARQHPLYGLWDVEEISRDGIVVPLLATDAALWRRFVFPLRTEAYIVAMSASPVGFSSRFDDVAQTITLTPWPRQPFRDSPVAPTLTFSYAHSDHDHLILNSQVGGAGSIVVRLRRSNPSKYTLVSHERRWMW